MTDAKATARSTVSAADEALIGLSHRIHAHPELNFEEVEASGWVAGVLADAGFEVEMGSPTCRPRSRRPRAADR